MKSFEEKLAAISGDLVAMCRAIENMIENCITALTTRDLQLAAEVKTAEKQVDKMERKIEKACINLLLMQHPVAGDFRDVYAALKMVTDLERIGDQARDIAKLTKKLAKNNELEIPESITQMAVAVTQMVRDGVAAYAERNLQLARSIESADDIVDALFKQATKDIISAIKKKTSRAKEGVALIMVAKYLERVGDHAVNVGEWVEYAITGKQPR